MLLAYLNALRRELVAFVMGSTPLALIGGVEHLRGQSIAWPLYGSAILCGFFVASYRVWTKERKRADWAEAGPRLQLHFDPSRPPYVQDLREPGPREWVGEDDLGPRARLRAFRVRIGNIGSDTAEQVRVVLDSIEPLPAHLPLSLPLHFMDSDRAPTAIPPGGMVFVDVIRVTVSEIAAASFAVQFTDPDSRLWNPVADNLVCLRVEGGRAPVYGSYRLSLDADGQAMMTEVETD